MSIIKPSNPPAFPRDEEHNGHNGMSLRDYFAAKHLQGVSGDREMWRNMCLDSNHTQGSPIDYIAKECYAMADAMLKQREL